MKITYVVAACAAVAVIPAPAAAQNRSSDQANRGLGLTFTTGLDYSTGDYGGPEDTKILVVPFSIRAKTGAFRVSASLPYLRIDGPGNIVGGGEGGPIVIDPNDPSPREVRDGLGDLGLSAAYSLPDALLAGFEVDIGGRVKLPTSSQSKRLGTGKTDFAVSLDVARPIGNLAPFVNVAYRMPGDPEGVELRNTIATSVGTTIGMGSSTLIASYDYSGAASRLVEDSHSLFAGLNFPLSERLSATGYGTAGLSDGAPDFGAGLLLSLRAF